MGQELEPRAYASAPVGLHALLGVYSRSDGSVVMDPTLPVEDVTADVNAVGVGYYQSFDFFGRFANIGLTVPYAWGSMQGRWLGDFTQITRSGLGDPRLRIAFNLTGVPAQKPVNFAKYRQKTNLGLSFTVSAPLGQYDRNKLINLGSNRWAFKPELGLSHVAGRWLLEAAGGVWILGANDKFLGTSKREQGPVLSLQGHATYNLPKWMWVAFDANFFTGGEARTDGVKSDSPTLCRFDQSVYPWFLQYCWALQLAGSEKPVSPETDANQPDSVEAARGAAVVTADKVGQGTQSAGDAVEKGLSTAGEATGEALKKAGQATKEAVAGGKQKEEQ